MQLASHFQFQNTPSNTITLFDTSIYTYTYIFIVPSTSSSVSTNNCVCLVERIIFLIDNEEKKTALSNVYKDKQKIV